MDKTKADVRTLCEVYKARGMTLSEAYDQFIIDRALRHEMDMKQFQKEYELAVPNPLLADTHTVQKNQIRDADLTHTLKETYSYKRRIRLDIETEHHIEWVDENGMQGSTPKRYIETFEVIE